MKRYILKVEPLTAVHIGTGEDMDPMSYTVKGGQLRRFRPENVIGRFPQDKLQEFERLIEANEHQKIAYLLHSQVTENDALYTMPVSAEVTRKFSSSLGKEENQLLIGETYRDPVSQKPVIPGSSIKGAIRTALANKMAEKIKPIPPGESKKSARFEHKLFGHSDAKDDPFRALHISDCPIEGDTVQIVSDYVNFKENRKRSQDFSRMSMMKEQIIGPLCGGDASGVCQLAIDEQLQYVDFELDKWQPIKEKFSLQDIISSCNEFYRQNFIKEYEKFYERSKYKELKENAKKVLKEIDKIDPQKRQCLIRLGRFSQIENITLNDPYRIPWNNKGYGETRTLTEDLFPSGLVKLTFLSLDEFQHEQRIKRQAEKQRIEEEQARLALEQAEKERLAQMTPDEKMLSQIYQLKPDPNEIALLVRDCLEQDLSREVFAALKSRLQEIGQWTPSGSKKRKEKMQARNSRIEQKL